MNFGSLYDASSDELLQARLNAKELCFTFNHDLRPSQLAEKEAIIHKLLGKIHGRFEITAPFWCDYGFNIEIGEGFYANHNLTILDTAPIIFGKNVFIGPNCCFAAPGHPLETNARRAALEFSHPIIIGNDVWFGSNVVVLPGVTIGDGAVIGAGSVVSKNIPPRTVAVGVPCKVLRECPPDIENFDPSVYPTTNTHLSLQYYYQNQEKHIEDESSSTQQLSSNEQ